MTETDAACEGRDAVPAPSAQRRATGPRLAAWARGMIRALIAGRRDDRRLAGFVLLGGMHHILHLIPVAAAASRREDMRVVIHVRSAEEEVECRRILAALGAGPVDIRRLSRPWLIGPYMSKSATLCFNCWRLLRVDCLVTAERTSTVLKRLPLPMPVMVHIPHGAGDRARGFEQRIARFDHVIVAGPKDRRRMIAAGVVTPDTCSVSGYVKTAAVSRIVPRPAPLFRNDRPVVLYNPHFDPELSSWPRFGLDILRAFAGQDRFNLIFAPHMRLFEVAEPRQRDEIAAFAREDRILIDLGGPRSTDMTYTRASDIYLGDVSSQVYEFLSEPRPCVFLSATMRDWRDDPDFAHWRYGEVCFDPAAAMAAIARAAARHPEFRPIQVEGVREALGDSASDAPEVAAACIAEIAWRAAP